MVECQICNKQFKSQKALNGHNSAVHKERPKLLRITVIKKCVKCNNDFEIQRTLSKEGKENISKTERICCSRKKSIYSHL